MLRLDVSQITEREAYQLLYEALESRKLALLAKVQDLSSELRRDGAHSRRPTRKTPNISPLTPKRRKLSPQARKAIVEGQKKRWKAYHSRKNRPKAAKRSENPE